ncbi:hypothetical protein [Mesorhizobium sp. Cs1321R2N1]|uniref:hypothetical protein n=1 Tax=Mesorhizobium sp. Cs1321R2N1 TaxID=3015174 RepID=UPI00301BA785
MLFKMQRPISFRNILAKFNVVMITMIKLSDLGPFEPHLNGKIADHESEYFYRCPQCGQMVDERDARQVVWHSFSTHERLLVDGDAPHFP